jgi:hypothetical protein
MRSRKEDAEKVSYGRGRKSPRHKDILLMYVPISQSARGIVSNFFSSPAPSEGLQG